MRVDHACLVCGHDPRVSVGKDYQLDQTQPHSRLFEPAAGFLVEQIGLL
jgi:hypothetical protein